MVHKVFFSRLCSVTEAAQLSQSHFLGTDLISVKVSNAQQWRHHRELDFLRCLISREPGRGGEIIFSTFRSLFLKSHFFSHYETFFYSFIIRPSVRPLNWTEHFSISTSRDCSSSFPSLRSHKMTEIGLWRLAVGHMTTWTWPRVKVSARIQCGWEDGDSSNRHFRVLQCGAGGSVLSGQGRSGYFKQNLSNAS